MKWPLRVQRLASWLSETAKQNGMAIRPGVVHKAACMGKADLTTELVKEFTELQGIVGGLYARAQELDPGLPESTRFAIAEAIYDQYKPQSAEDSVPRTVEGAVLSIADKADSIAGMFALGLHPTGSKDPFALRRQANGIVKTIAEYKLPFKLLELAQDAKRSYRGSDAEKKFAATVNFDEAIETFFRERLEFYLKEIHGFKYDVVNAVLAAGSEDVSEAVARAEAVTKARPSADFGSIASAFKRIKNILRQATEAGKNIASSLDANALQEPAEEGIGIADSADCAESRSAAETGELLGGAGGDLQVKACRRHILRQSHGHGRRRAHPLQSAFSAANVTEGIFHHSRLLRNRD